MTTPSPRRSMVRALRRRVLLVVAAAVILVGVASVWGLRLVTDRNAERQVHIAAQSVTTWGADDDGVRVIDNGHFAAVDSASTVVALLSDDGRVIVTTSGLPVTVSALESVERALASGEIGRANG